LKISRASFIIGFVMAPRVEALTRQYIAIYDWIDLLKHPIALMLLGCGIVAILYGMIYSKSTIEYV